MAKQILNDAEDGSVIRDKINDNFTEIYDSEAADRTVIDKHTSINGVTESSANLGSFTGSTITNGATTKSALQELETYAEDGRAITEKHTLALGIPETQANMGSFTGSLIPNGQTAKEAMQVLETAVEELVQPKDDLFTLSGIAEGAPPNLAAFTGATIPNGQSIKNALQYLETQLELGNLYFNPKKNTWPKRSTAVDLCSSFRAAMLALDTDVNIVFVGDSIFAKTTNPTQFSATELKTAPVWSSSYDTLFRLFNLYVMNKPDFFRFDADGIFSETGTFDDGYEIFQEPTVPAWSDAEKTESNRSRYSQTASAAINFDWNLATYEKCNFIHDLHIDGADAITFGVSGGNGKIEVYNGSLWVEANGYVFSQYIDSAVATEASGYGQQVNKVRLKLRRVLTTGTFTCSFTKDATSDYFFYWGLEFWNGKTIHFHNTARGGMRAAFLNNFINDIALFTPHLIVSECPLINEALSTTNINTIKNRQQDFIWGDRSGALNALSLKNVYPTIDAVIVLPHLQVEGYSADKPINFSGLSGNPIDVINNVKQLFEGRTDYYYIDILQELIEIAKLNEWTLEEAFTAGTVIGNLPASFLQDGKHQNDYGSLVWAMILNSNLKLA